MAASLAEIKSWLQRAEQNNAGSSKTTVTHVIVKCDTFDMLDGNCCYPVYVTSDQDVREVDSKNGDKTEEVYAMHLPIESQLSERRAFHWESAT